MQFPSITVFNFKSKFFIFSLRKYKKEKLVSEKLQLGKKRHFGSGNTLYFVLRA